MCTNEQGLSKQGTEYRADIFDATATAVIDITCVQTSQNKKTLDKALEDAYEGKVKKYNDMKNHCELLPQFKEGVKLIPVVIGPRGQFYRKSWQDLTRLLDIENSKATKQELAGVAPLLLNKTVPEKALLAISLLKALAFRVAVTTASNAREWQSLQQERWNSHSGVTITKPNKNKQ